MTWDKILKTEHVWILSEGTGFSMMDTEIIGAFKSEEALEEWILKEHHNTMNYDEHAENTLERIIITYGYTYEKVEVKG